MPTDERRWTDADRDTVAAALRQHHIVLDPDDRAREHDACVCGPIVEDWDEHWSVVALDALTADGWRRPCAICAKPPTIVCNCPPLMIGDSDAR